MLIDNYQESRTKECKTPNAKRQTELIKNYSVN